jgi:hypothetical protein
VLGTEYFGAGPSYPLAAWFALWGTSTLALEVFVFGLGLLILWTAYLVLRRLLDPIATRFALAVLAAPPLLLTRWSVTGAPNHPALLVFGCLALGATHALFFRRRGRKRAILVLGLLAGLGWWTNPLMIVYLAPFGLLAVRTGLVRQARAWLFPLGLLAGSLPQWLYELRHFPSARFALLEPGSVPVLSFGERVALLAGRFVPQLLGLDLSPNPVPIVSFAGLALLGLTGVSVIRAVLVDRGELTWLVGMGGRPAQGRSMLWMVAATNVALVLASERAIGNYYLLSLYLALATWIGDTLAWLWRIRRVVGYVAVAGLLGFDVVLNWQDTLGTTPPSARRWAPIERSVKPLVQWLDEQGARCVYWADVSAMPAWEFSYLTGERIVAADLWNEAAQDLAPLVDAAPAPPIVARRGSATARSLEAGLRALGMTVRESAAGGFLVIQPVPDLVRRFAPLRPEGWRFTASENTVDAAHLLDRDAATRWTTNAPQHPGQWIAVDLGADRLVTRLDLLSTDWEEMPAGVRVDVSRNGIRWDEVAAVPDYWGPLFFSERHPFLKIYRGRVQAVFPPTPARFVRVVQTGTSPYHDWSARELFLYAPAPSQPPPRPRPGEVTAALRRAGVRFVYASHWLSAWVRVDSRGTIGTLESNAGAGPPRVSPVSVRLAPGYGLLLGSDADADGIRAALAGQPVGVRETTAGPYPLLVFEPQPSPRRLGKAGWRATASEHAESAARTIDGTGATAWTSATPPAPDVALTVDLGAVRRLSRLEVRPGPAAGGRDVRLEGSADGTAWKPLEPLRWSGRLYWTGSELLRIGEPWAGTVPPTDVRYVRLRPVGVADGRPWVVREVDAFEPGAPVP